MESSNQQSSDELSQEPALAEGGLAEPALFEFTSASEVGKPVATSAVTTPATLEIQPGVPYPPPPSFYENMPEPEEERPLPLPSPLTAQATLMQPSGGGYPGVPQSPYQFQPGMPPAANPFQPGPSPFQARPPRKRASRKTLWIVFSIVGAVLLLTCGLCSWGAVSFLGPVVQGATAITNVVTDYYQDIEANEYAPAYADLQVTGLTQSVFTQQAQQRDTLLGSVSSFEVTGATPDTSDSDTSTNFTEYSVTLTIHRPGSSYPVHLVLHSESTLWKITSFDAI
jgi:hypothetical protein